MFEAIEQSTGWQAASGTPSEQFFKNNGQQADGEMNDEKRQTRSYLMQLFEENGFHPRTDLGQNFLIDLNIVEYIVDQADIKPDDVVLEVGAGTGGMTTFLAQQAAEVISVELDTNMYKLASKVVENYDNVTLLCTDILKNKNQLSPEVLDEVQRKLDAEPGRRLKLVSNLPYSVATPVVSNLVATELPWSQMVITIQQELGYRMSARPGRKLYGALSIWLQAQCRVKILKKMPPSVFWPRPKVNSTIVSLRPNPVRKKKIVDRPFFHDFIRRLFHHRRKLMRSVLVGMYRKQIQKPEADVILQDLGISLLVRAEELGVEKLVEVSNQFYHAINKVQAAQPAVEKTDDGVSVN